MSQKVKDLLQRINFIETDMELHKQILASIPSNDRAEIQKTIETIARLKHQTIELKQEIKAVDINEYQKIVKLEKAAETFKQIAGQKTFSEVNTLNESGKCQLDLKDGTTIECLVAAREENGDWTVLTIDGDTRSFAQSEIKE